MSRPARVSSCPGVAGLRVLTLIAVVLLGSAPLTAAGPPELAGLDALYPSLDALYIDPHRNPELSLQEEKTAAKMSTRLRAPGFQGTGHGGGHGGLGGLKNGAGPPRPGP